MPYRISLITLEEKDRLAARFTPNVRYEIKSEIYGCCIKLLSDDPVLRGTWQENFYSMSQNIRSHGRMYVFRDPDYPPDSVFYEPQSRTAFLLNVRYYGWIKSLALSLTSDILEDEHAIFSVHGACIDIAGSGLCLIGTSGAGKTTQTYGLLRQPHTRIISDDWFFSRVFGPEILAYGSEKNFYIRQDLETVWKEFGGLVRAEEYDRDGRAVADIRWVIGKGRMLPMTTLRTVIILKRDPADRNTVQSLNPDAALALFERNNFFNPHFLVSNPYKTAIRMKYMKDLLDRTVIYEVNTTGTPEGTQKMIRSLVAVPQAGS
ncbi:MAG: aldolase [Methanoregula sp.]|uniref:HPr kinase/phosphorylase n=1 Tax=Methanoregula sp. TaxID=2052170 RepID=UPI0025CCA58C|nr:aldolase [Methanoregula sp.]MCK9630919.1 aldolase [Methanoregula sp.]